MMTLHPLLQRMVTILVVVVVIGIIWQHGNYTLMSDSDSAEMENENFSLDVRLHFNTEGNNA